MYIYTTPQTPLKTRLFFNSWCIKNHGAEQNLLARFHITCFFVFTTASYWRIRITYRLSFSYERSILLLLDLSTWDIYVVVSRGIPFISAVPTHRVGKNWRHDSLVFIIIIVMLFLQVWCHGRQHISHFFEGILNQAMGDSDVYLCLSWKIKALTWKVYPISIGLMSLYKSWLVYKCPPHFAAHAAYFMAKLFVWEWNCH